MDAKTDATGKTRRENGVKSSGLLSWTTDSDSVIFKVRILVAQLIKGC